MMKKMIKHQNNNPNLQQEEEEEEEKRDWSHIPGQFLWGVMNYLPPFDAMRIPYVCNSWKSIIKPEPNKVIIPWVLCNPSSSISTDRIFIDLSTNAISRVKIPDIVSQGTCISSKHGWLLLHPNSHPMNIINEVFYSHRVFLHRPSKYEPNTSIANSKCTLRLFHPVSGTVIDLPEIQEEDCSVIVGPAIIGAVSELTGKPELIIQASYRRQKGIVLRITRAGQSQWEEHRFKHCIGWETTVARVAMHGNTRVCCFDPKGRMCVFDMEDESWLTFPDLCNSRSGFVVECEDEIVKVAPLPPFVHGNQEWYMFYKLGLNEHGVIGWVEMERVGLENKWWFLDRNGESYCVKGVGRKVFQLFGHYGMVRNGGGRVRYRIIDNEVRVPLTVVDLAADGVPQELMPELALKDCNLGWILMDSPVSV
ncbi:F-box domain-containing protein [Dioscorea alata]|uniref:F-box domain-containing protein n=1 Tax=Dioscorea alata TaxID=55571 RepID=A0ACB7TWU3_DIOAL|nr:F-box domain-containing protein [Dioscorea alata]